MFLLLTCFIITVGAIYEPCRLSRPSCPDLNAECKPGFGFPDPRIPPDRDSGQCTCKAGFSFSGSKCIRPPELGESCDGEAYGFCQTQNSVCQNSRCVCMKGYQQSPGKKECTKTRRLLDEQCRDGAECTSPFSTCEAGRCRCHPGFSRQGASCVPQKFACTIGEPLVERGVRKLCKIGAPFTLLPPGVPGSSEQSCPAGYFCAIIDGSYDTQAEGFCCKMMTPTCPVGAPHPRASCSAAITASVSAPAAGTEPYCPMETHQCLFDQAAGAAACCARRCKAEDVFANGRCLPMLRLGEACEVAAQCARSFGSCINQGGRKICACTGDEIETTSGYCTAARCPLSLSLSMELPLKGPTGQTVRCGNSSSSSIGATSDCPSGYSCLADLNVCCRREGSFEGICGLGRLPLYPPGSGGIMAPLMCNLGGSVCPAGYICTPDPKGTMSICCTAAPVNPVG